MKKAVLATVLASSFWLNACTVPSWVTTVESDATVAAQIALGLVTIVDPALIPLVTAINTGLTAIDKATAQFKASPTATNLQALQALVASVQGNLTEFESAAQIKNAGAQDEVAGIVSVLSAAVNEIAAQVPASASAASLKGSSTTAKAYGGEYFKKQFNEIAKRDQRLKELK